MNHPSNPRLFSFIGGRTGPWQVTASRAVTGDALAPTARMAIVPDNITAPPPEAAWVLRGATSNERYVTRAEK